MQFHIRLNDSNTLTISAQLSDVPSDNTNGPAVASAVVTNVELSDISTDDFLYTLAESLDIILQPEQEKAAVNEDWREAFRRG